MDQWLENLLGTSVKRYFDDPIVGRRLTKGEEDKFIRKKIAKRKDSNKF